jgi:aminoglycoside phosphotransferase (APT) family kinase protein
VTPPTGEARVERTALTDTAGWRSFCAARGLRDPQPVARGLDFTVLRLTGPDGAPVAVRVPHGRFSSDVNDPHVDRRVLLRQEYALTRHLAAHGVPVARPRELFRSAAFDVLVSDFLPDDGAGTDGAALGRLLARLHAVPPPPVTPVASEGGRPTGEVLVRRLVRRWAELTRLQPDLPPLPTPATLTGLLPTAPGRALLHLDVRAANLRTVGRRRPVLVDWANALVGDPGLELARVAEYARMADNGVDLAGLLAGYGPAADDLLAAPAFPLYRLDACVMLALVFRAEAPHPVRGPEWTARAAALAAALPC